jgi:hypothetical protein
MPNTVTVTIIPSRKVCVEKQSKDIQEVLHGSDNKQKLELKRT